MRLYVIKQLVHDCWNAAGHWAQIWELLLQFNKETLIEKGFDSY